MRIAGIKRRLNKRVRTGFGRANGTGRAVVEVCVGADQVDGHLIPAVGNRIAVAIHLNGFGHGEAAETEFLKEREQPAFARICGGGIAEGFFGDGLFEIFPTAFETIPASVNLLIQPFALSQMIRHGRDALDGGLGVGQFVEKIGGQKSAFRRNGNEGGGRLHSTTTGKKM